MLASFVRVRSASWVGVLAAVVGSVACSEGDGVGDSAQGTSTSETTSTTSTTTSTTTTTTTTTSTSTSTTTTTTTTTGSGGGGGGWPTCDSQPGNVPAKTLHEIWVDDPVAPTEAWIAGVYVTAISKSGCVDGQACQIFVQQQESFPSFAAGSQQALKIFVSAATAMHFTGLAVGDRVDVLAHAWRYDVGGEHELLLQVNQQLPGCAKKIGSGTPTPVTGVTLSQLSVDAYENAVGPLLVQVDGVSGKPAMPSETFGLWTTGAIDDAGLANVTSLSPYMLAGGAFSGLQEGKTHDFGSVTGVFGIFVLTGNDPPPKYEEIYPRVMGEVVVDVVHP